MYQNCNLYKSFSSVFLIFIPFLYNVSKRYTFYLLTREINFTCPCIQTKKILDWKKAIWKWKTVLLRNTAQANWPMKCVPNSWSVYISYNFNTFVFKFYLSLDKIIKPYNSCIIMCSKLSCTVIGMFLHFILYLIFWNTNSSSLNPPIAQ